MASREHRASLATKRLPCLLFRDPITGEPYPWEFHRGKEVVAVPVSGRVTMSDPVTYLEACLAGLGIAQLFHLGNETFLRDGTANQPFPRLGLMNDFRSTSIMLPAIMSPPSCAFFSISSPNLPRNILSRATSKYKRCQLSPVRKLLLVVCRGVRVAEN